MRVGTKFTKGSVNHAMYAARVGKHLTQQQVADAVGIGRGYYVHIENNTRACSVYMYARIAKVLGVPFKSIVPTEKQIDDLFN